MKPGQVLLSVGIFASGLPALGGQDTPWEGKHAVFASRREVAAILVGYFEEMCRPRPFDARTGDALKAHQRTLREKLLACAALWPLPERVPLDARYSPPLDHEWCMVRRVAYQLWPGVYSTGLLYLPKQFAERPAPAVLCPHGHWENGNAHPVVQTRCLVLAKMGYVVFSSTQNHYEDPAIGVSQQTLMIWNNVRALDFLESLPEVDKARIGVTGCSGGGLQTQMLVAADGRVKAATIVGMTCDYREIVFAGAAHCACNHFPNIMRHTDEPELSALGLPAAVQYLTMNDWTRSFAQNNYPTIRRLYELNGLPGRTDCYYEPVGHSYDKTMRERMYAWMERWLHGKGAGNSVPEPETKTFPVPTLLNLKADLTGDKGFGHVSRLYTERFHYVVSAAKGSGREGEAPAEPSSSAKSGSAGASPSRAAPDEASRDRGNVVPKVGDRKDWEAYREKMRGALGELLGEPLARRGAAKTLGTEERDGVAVERVLCPSEGGILVPAVILRPAGAKGKLPAVILCDERGKEAALAATGDGSPAARARGGALVVLPDVRFVGELSLKALAGLTGQLLTFKACCPLGEGDPNGFDGAWQRNALLWGRPFPGVGATDLRAVLDAVLARPDADPAAVSLVARGSLAAAALFAAALDNRVAALDADFGGACFENRRLPLVPFVLQRGDVLQWSALLAARRLTLAGVPREAGDPAWLREVFRAAGNPDGLKLAP